MTVKARAQLKAENAADFPNNQTRLISPADLRGQMDDVADSALLREDVPGLDVSQAVVTATGDDTQTLANWMGDIGGGEGSGGLGVDGMVQLRLRSVVAGQSIHLNYHTTPGDYGAGQFYGVTSGGPYTDNDGTIITAEGGAWLRVWDHVKAHVGWFGAKCDNVTDDYAAVTKCFGLFTNGRTAGSAAGTLNSGVVDVGPGFCFSQPLIYGGSIGSSFKLVGMLATARGAAEKSMLRYTGPATLGALIFYGANQWSIDDINFHPGLALNGVMIIADNTYNNSGDHTTTHAITAGTNVVVTPSGATAADKTFYLQPGVMLGVDAGGPNFEIVYISAVDTVAGTFTATFAKNHASGVLLGDSLPSSGGRVNRCRFICPSSPIFTKLTASAPGSGTKTFVVSDITGVSVGHPLRIGHGVYQEVVYPITVNSGAKSFTADSSFDHDIDGRVMYPTSAILFGNRLLGTVQVSEIAMYDTHLQGDAAAPVDGVHQTKCYAGVRQIWGGNVKNFTFHTMYVSSIKVPFAFEQPSGQYIISGGVSGNIEDTLFYCPGGALTVEAWEDESLCIWLVAHSGASHATFIGCTMQGSVPTADFAPVTDEIFYHGGQLTFIGCELLNSRIYGTTLPIIVCTGIDSDLAFFHGSVTLISCLIVGVTSANLGSFIRRSPGDATNVVNGTSRFTMLNCNGGNPSTSSISHLPNIIPAQTTLWQGTATSIDPPSLAAAAVGTIGTIAVSGAALGDLVESSFSLDLQGAVLRAWVSAADTVKYQFANPTAAPIDLGSGTVKVRVKK